MPDDRNLHPIFQAGDVPKDAAIEAAFAKINAAFGSRVSASYCGPLDGLADSIAEAGRYRLRGEDR